MKLKQYIFAAACVVVGMSTQTASADGGMMPVTVSAPVSPVATPLTDDVIKERIAVLKNIVRLTTYVQALVEGIPEAEHGDEGMLTVVVNDSMIAPCDGDEGQEGEQCVRHKGKLGDSTVDLATITNFSYSTDFSYHLTLMKTRSANYGKATGPQYDYFLVRVEEVTSL